MVTVPVLSVSSSGFSCNEAIISSLLHPCSIVQSFETMVSTFAQQRSIETPKFVFTTETILLVAESVSLECMVVHLVNPTHRHVHCGLASI